MKRLLCFLVVSCLAVTLSAGGKKYIYCGWDLGRASLEEIAANADLFRDTAADGVSLYANYWDEKGAFRQLGTPFSSEIYAWTLFERMIPHARTFAEKSGLSDNFLKVAGAPAKRLGWLDDTAWSRAAANLATLARFAKASGQKGFVLDFEDYRRARQYVRAEGDPDYDTCLKIVRKRGAELFREAFRAFPEIRMLVYYFYTSEMRYVGETDSPAVLRAHDDMFPAFLDGIMDVLPETARIYDGNEIGYRLEAQRGDFWRYAEHQHVGILPLVAPELREKYRRQVGISFGLYIDSYIYEKTGRYGEYYMGPMNGSRLTHFRANLAQATEVADEYVWMWNEYHPYVKWRRNKRCADLMAKGTLEETLPGVTETMLSVRSPARYIERFCSAKDNLTLKLPAEFAQTEGSRKAGGKLSRADADGREQCYVFEGVSNGYVAWRLGTVKAGEAFAFAADWKGEGTPIGRCAWSLNGHWIYSVAPVRLVWSESDADGWRHGEGTVVVPLGVDHATFELDAIQHKGEKMTYGSVRVFKLKAY